MKLWQSLIPVQKLRFFIHCLMCFMGDRTFKISFNVAVCYVIRWSGLVRFCLMWFG